MTPPRWAERCLRWGTPARYYEELSGDLHELFPARADRDGLPAARRWYWRQVAAALVDTNLARRHRRSPIAAGDSPMQTLMQDIRYAIRSLRRQPAFTITAVFMLALGVGANATVFSWINSVLLNPLPGTTRVHELVQLGYIFRGSPLPSFSYPDYRDIRDATRTMSGIAMRDDLAVGVQGDGDAERAWAELVSANFFDVLGVQPWRGRFFTSADDVPGTAPVVVLGYDYWRARFAGDERVIGRQLRINAQMFTVAGIAPPGFNGGESGLRFDMWLPVGTQPMVMPGGSRLDVRGSQWAALIGRRREGHSVESVRSEMAALVSRLRPQPDLTGTAFTFSESPTGGISVLRPVLLVLMTVAAIVLLIACANLAGLLLARASARQRELAIRLSVGAGRSRLVQQLLVEGSLLALAGGAGALVALRWTSGLLMGFAPPSELPIHIDVAVDGRVLGFTCLIATATLLLFALIPALQATMSDVIVSLKDSGSAGRAFGRHRLRRGLVAAQIALSTVLLVGAGLCLRSVSAAQAMTPGFVADGVVVGWLDLVPAGHTGETARAFYLRLLDAVRALPGVDSVSLARRIPLGFMGGSSSNITVPGYKGAPDEPRVVAVNYVGPEYLRTMRIPLVAGRDVSDDDLAGRPGVAVISESVARRYWPDGNAVGGQFHFGRNLADPKLVITVIGVAKDIKQRSMTEPPQPTVFLPVLQSSVPSVVLHVRAAAAPSQIAGELPRVVRELDPGVTFYNVSLLADHTKAATFQQRMAADLLVVFGALALLLAAVGSYGVLSYLVGQRRREIGIRLAIGAPRRTVFRLIVVSGVRLLAIGAAVGLVLAAGAGFGLRSLLIGVPPLDPVTFGAVATVLLIVGLLACAIPARRAAAVDPVLTLRQE